MAGRRVEVSSTVCDEDQPSPVEKRWSGQRCGREDEGRDGIRKPGDGSSVFLINFWFNLLRQCRNFDVVGK